MNAITTTIAAAACAIGSGGVVHAEPIVYQGALQDAGAPADGEYDFRFRLYDSVTSGVQVGPQVVAENLQVSAGVFQLDLDFGDVFNGADRWLEIDMRQGDSGGVFTVLTPRQAIRSAPQAIHARTAETVVNPQWNENGDDLDYGDGDDRVLINRDAPITGAEYFGVNSTIPGFVGMYISGPAGSQPFYGYSVNGGVSAYTSYTDNRWRLFKDGAFRVEVDPNNDLLVSEDVVADNFRFSSPKTRYYSVSGNAFKSHFDYFANGGQGGAHLEDPSGWLSAGVNLPHGARVTRMVAYCRDNVVGDMSVSLSYQAHNGTGNFTMASVTTAGVAGSSLELVDSTIDSQIIDNINRHYVLRVFSSAWTGSQSDMRISSVLIEYEVDEAK